MPPHEPHPPQRGPDAPDARTQVQSSEGVAASVELSIPQHVRQHASAPKLPGYVLAEPLGEGAYGQVWRAWQLRTRKEVAVKVFLQRSGLDWIFLQREVERLTRLDKHPHIVTLLDTNLDEEPPFYVMELVGKGSLQQWVTVSSPADPRRAVRWMAEIADALSYVHAKGLIHCDLKPANILIDERDCIRVVDFGQSRVFTESAASLGTLFYMAPEQAIPAQAGSPIQPDLRWDVYALGATLYAILTGRVPYASVTNVQRLEQATTLAQRLTDYRKMLEHDPRPSWDRSPVNPEVRAVVDKCMAPIAAQRYSAVTEVAADLRAIEKKRPVTPLAGSTSYRAKKFVQRNPLQIGLIAAAVALGIALLWSSAQQTKLDRAKAADIMTAFAHDPQSASQQALPASGRVAKFLREISVRYVSSPASLERVLGARGALFIQPDAFWRSIDGGPLWTHGEWLELCGGSWRGHDRLLGELGGKTDQGVAREKYVALCLMGQLADNPSAVSELLVKAAAETDPGVHSAANWAAARLAVSVPRTATKQMFVDEVSGLVFAAIPPTNDFRRGSLPDDPDRLADEDMPQQGAAIGAIHMSVIEVTLTAVSEFWKNRWNAVLLALPTDQRERYQRNFEAQFQGLTPEQQTTTAVGHVSLFMARMYCDWLNLRAEGKTPKRSYRLPTEDEWEYACRAGNTGRFCFGDDASYAGYFAHCNGSTATHHVVAQRMPNAFGLFDMHGGLWELTDSRYPPELAPPELANEELYVRKGGAWYSPAFRCRSAQRNYSTANAMDAYTGLRLVMELQP